MNSAKASVWIATLYLAVYTGLFSIGASSATLAIMFFMAPFLIIGMVYAILKDSFKYPDLGDDEEWGYRDKDRRDLGLFGRSKH